MKPRELDKIFDKVEKVRFERFVESMKEQRRNWTNEERKGWDWQGRPNLWQARRFRGGK